jgi:hypothetical protein
VLAGTVNCELSGSQPDWTSMHTNMELKPANVNITVGSNLADWQMIYEMKNVVIGRFIVTAVIVGLVHNIHY